MTNWPLIASLNLEHMLKGAKHVLLFSDFDGTLVPIANHPVECRLTEQARMTLESLARLSRCSVAIISGRELADLQQKVALKNIGYAGNHGLEIEMGSLRYTQLAAATLRNQLLTLAELLTHYLADIPGAWVQHKGLSLSIHYRQVSTDLHARVQQVIRDGMTPHLKQGHVVLRDGKMVVEVRPAVAWHKGSCTRWLYEQLRLPEGTRVVYLGDDQTDEDAFAAWPEEITIRVGPGDNSLARYMLPDTEAVQAFLQELQFILQ